MIWNTGGGTSEGEEEKFWSSEVRKEVGKKSSFKISFNYGVWGQKWTI